MAAIIETKGLTKQYGKLTALNELTITVEEGSVVGFIGPNGAGKTTTMRILTTLLRPTRGEAYVAGFSVEKEPDQVRRAIGYMPDYFGVASTVSTLVAYFVVTMIFAYSKFRITDDVNAT